MTGETHTHTPHNTVRPFLPTQYTQTHTHTHTHTHVVEAISSPPTLWGVCVRVCVCASEKIKDILHHTKVKCSKVEPMQHHPEQAWKQPLDKTDKQQKKTHFFLQPFVLHQVLEEALGISVGEFSLQCWDSVEQFSAGGRSLVVSHHHLQLGKMKTETQSISSITLPSSTEIGKRQVQRQPLQLVMVGTHTVLTLTPVHRLKRGNCNSTGENALLLLKL